MAEHIPVVSVLMTAYNREGYIAEALESVLASTFSDFELIVVDDCSSDRTAKVAEAYAAREPRIRLFINERNFGDYPNRNHAASYARGKYLKYVDSDDVIYPHGLEVMVRCMEAVSDAGLGMSALADPDAPYPQYLTPAAAYREHFFVMNTLGRAPGSAIILRRAFEDVGGFSGKRQVGDHELWLKIAARHGVVKMPANLLWSRQHTEQEKAYDSEIDKVVMHEEVLVAALLAPGCPLNERERNAALAHIKGNRARHYWRFMTQGGGPKVASEYRRRVRIPATSLVSFTLARLRRSAVSEAPVRGEI